MTLLQMSMGAKEDFYRNITIVFVSVSLFSCTYLCIKEIHNTSTWTAINQSYKKTGLSNNRL